MRSKRLEQLPAYLFEEIDRRKAEFARSGREVLDLGIGDPDLGAPPELVKKLVACLDGRDVHRYPSGRGHPELVDAIRGWAKDIHGTDLGRDELLVTIGSKEAIAHLPLAVTDPGDLVLIPDPGYPVYNSSVIFADAQPIRVPISESNGYWADPGSLDGGLLERAKLLFLNYPNNPTSAVIASEIFESAARTCRENNILIANDAAYSEIFFDERPAVLFPVARKSQARYIEFFSFSKTFSITGWRIGFAIGSPEVISSLGLLKANIDSGVFSAIQLAVGSILRDGYEEITGRTRKVFLERRKILAKSLEKAGFSFSSPSATFYFWVRTPGKDGSIRFCARLLEDTGIVATPGVGFGRHGEGYFRLSMTADTDTIARAGKIIEGYNNRD